MRAHTARGALTGGASFFLNMPPKMPDFCFCGGFFSWEKKSSCEAAVQLRECATHRRTAHHFDGLFARHALRPLPLLFPDFNECVKNALKAARLGCWGPSTVLRPLT